MLEYMDIYPHAHPVVRVAFFGGVFSILATAASLSFDIRRNRLKA
jgi:hypothetical protein